MKAVVWLAGSALALVTCGCLGFVAPIELALSLTLGWVAFLGRAVVEMTVDWPAIATVVVCLAAVGFGIDRFGRWLLHHQSPPRTWQSRWTFVFLALTVLPFIAGISAVGIAHQLAWLASAPGGLFDQSNARFGVRVQSASNLKQIGIGVHSFADASAGALPPGATVDRNGRLLHGWQTLLLPYIEQQELFATIDLQVPWNHPRNAKAFKTPVWLYRAPVSPDVADLTLTQYSANVYVLGIDRPLTFTDFKDGTANTIMAGEVAENWKPWGHPMNWRDPGLGINQDPNGFGSPFGLAGVNFLLSDGVVRFVSQEITPDVLKAMATPAGGEKVDYFE